MTVTLRRAIAIGVIIGEVCVAAYLSFMGWLLCVWMVDDSQAFRMQPSDWYLAAATRFIEVAAVATAFGLVAALLNCWVVRR